MTRLIDQESGTDLMVSDAAGQIALPAPHLAPVAVPEVGAGKRHGFWAPAEFLDVVEGRHLVSANAKDQTRRGAAPELSVPPGWASSWFSILKLN